MSERDTGALGREAGWGARIRTWDAGTKNRSLTAWRRPTMSEEGFIAKWVAKVNAGKRSDDFLRRFLLRKAMNGAQTPH